MALVKKMEKVSLERDLTHEEVDATFCVVEQDGEKCLQIDTYGSSSRQDRGKKSQSIRLTKTAIRQLQQIISEF